MLIMLVIVLVVLIVLIIPSIISEIWFEQDVRKTLAYRARIQAQQLAAQQQLAAENDARWYGAGGTKN